MLCVLGVDKLEEQRVIGICFFSVLGVSQLCCCVFGLWHYWVMFFSLGLMCLGSSMELGEAISLHRLSLCSLCMCAWDLTCCRW